MTLRRLTDCVKLSPQEKNNNNTRRAHENGKLTETISCWGAVVGGGGDGGDLGRGAALVDVTFRHSRKGTPTPPLSTLFHTHQHESESGRCPVHLCGEACGAEALPVFHEVRACFFTAWHEETLQSNGVKHLFIPCDASKGKKCILAPACARCT